MNESTNQALSGSSNADGWRRIFLPSPLINLKLGLILKGKSWWK